MAGSIPVYCAFDKIVPVEELKPNPKNPNRHPGDQVELWSLWVGGEPSRPVRYAGALTDFDLETLRQFFTAEAICITITI